MSASHPSYTSASCCHGVCSLDHIGMWQHCLRSGLGRSLWSRTEARLARHSERVQNLRKEQRDRGLVWEKTDAFISSVISCKHFILLRVALESESIKETLSEWRQCILDRTPAQSRTPCTHTVDSQKHRKDKLNSIQTVSRAEGWTLCSGATVQSSNATVVLVKDVNSSLVNWFHLNFLERYSPVPVLDLSSRHFAGYPELPWHFCDPIPYLPKWSFPYVPKIKNNTALSQSVPA